MRWWWCLLCTRPTLDFNSANSLKQQSVDRDVVWLLTCNLDSELLFFKWCGEEANTNVIVFVLIRLGIYLTLAKHANHYIMMPILCDTIWFLVLNTIFSNISTISWQSVLVVEEAGVPTENPDHGQATGKLYHLRLRVECALFCNLQSPARTHAALVIGLHELLGNPTT
jgi:hypothetical protein